MLSIFLLTYEFGKILHSSEEETHTGEQTQTQLSDVCWRPGIVIHAAGQDMLF